MNSAFCPKCLFTPCYLQSQLHVFVTHFLRQQKSQQPLRNVTFACPNTWHCSLTDHLVLPTLDFCVASSLNVGSLSAYPGHMCPLRHAVPQGPLLHDDFYFLPAVQKHALEAHSRPYQDRCRKHAQQSLFGQKSSIWRGDALHKSCRNVSSDDDLELTSVKSLHKIVGNREEAQKLCKQLTDFLKTNCQKKQSGLPNRFCF